MWPPSLSVSSFLRRQAKARVHQSDYDKSRANARQHEGTKLPELQHNQSIRTDQVRLSGPFLAPRHVRIRAHCTPEVRPLCKEPLAASISFSQMRRELTLSENILLCLALQQVQVVQQRQHILWRLLDSKKRLQTW